MGKKLIAGMYGPFKAKPILSPSQMRQDMSVYLTAVFAWTSFCLLLAAVVSAWMSVTTSFSEYLLTPAVPVLLFFGSMFLFFGTAKALDEGGGWAYALCCMHWCILGATSALFFRAIFGVSIAAVPFAAGVTFGLLAAYQQWSSRGITEEGNDLFAIGGLGLLLSAACVFAAGGSSTDYLFCLSGAAGASTLLASNLPYIRGRNKAGNAGTAADHKERITGSMLLYLHVMLLFLQVASRVPLKGESRKSSSKHSFGGGRSFRGGGSGAKW